MKTSFALDQLAGELLHFGAVKTHHFKGLIQTFTRNQGA
jgi:hypothetical protein